MMQVRRSTGFFMYFGLMMVLFLVMFLHARYARLKASVSTYGKRTMVREMRLTDLCLFPEASYTRHLSLADTHTPFQDSPGAFEHFPSGMLAPPPHYVRGDTDHVVD